MKALLTAIVVASASACAPDLAPEQWAGVEELGGPFSQPIDPWRAVAPFQPVQQPLPADQQEIIDRIVERSDAFFDREPPAAVLEEAELIFFAARRTHELADLYRAAADRQGPASWVRPRYAWLLERLGLSDAARREIAVAVEARPTDPQAHFVRGLILARTARGDDEARLRELRDAFERVLELDPNFVGVSGLNADDIREQLAELDRLLP
jgi:tetratricopeptide (TPR) repeat protein